ncbi:MAG: hypothetical protein WCA23_23545, partial [Stellaceae bacterium]
LIPAESMATSSITGTSSMPCAHRLKDQQDGIAVGCVEQLLQQAQLTNVRMKMKISSKGCRGKRRRHQACDVRGQSPRGIKRKKAYLALA